MGKHTPDPETSAVPKFYVQFWPGTTNVPGKDLHCSVVNEKQFESMMLARSQFYQSPFDHRSNAHLEPLPAVRLRKWSFSRSVDVKTGFMPRLGNKNRAARILSAPKARTLHSRPPLNRFQEIFHAIKTGRYPNRTKLAETIEVTTKTIQRDIDYMRYQMSVPIEFDYARGGYHFTRPMTELPLFQLTEAELVSVFVAQKALEAYKGTAFEQPLRTAFQKLQAATGSANVSVSWEDLDSAISFRQFGAYLPDATIFSELAKAIQNKEVVEFGYKKLDAKASEKRTVEPWHLACVSGQWYLLGYDRNRKARRIFVLARMQKVSRTGHKLSNFTTGGGGDSTALPEQFQIWQGENADLEQIFLKFSGRAAQLVRERNWRASQQIQELAGGNLELSLTLNSLEEVIPWILSWGKNCEVVRPTKLQRKVRSLFA
jgi:predicted DNA-binding transcriptional regulator YafY